MAAAPGVTFVVVVSEVVPDPGHGGTPEQAFVVPNNSAFHLLLKNKGPASVTVHQDGAFITPLPQGQSLLRTFRTPGRLSVQAAVKATVEVTVVGVHASG
jgi:hypothetical protein